MLDQTLETTIADPDRWVRASIIDRDFGLTLGSLKKRLHERKLFEGIHTRLDDSGRRYWHWGNIARYTEGFTDQEDYAPFVKARRRKTRQ